MGAFLYPFLSCLIIFTAMRKCSKKCYDERNFKLPNSKKSNLQQILRETYAPIS